MTPAKRGPAPLLGDRLDSLVQEHVRKLRAAGAVVCKSIVISAATGIVRHKQRTLLPEFGGTLILDRSWSASLLRRMGYVRRKGTQAARKVPSDFPQLKEDFLQRISTAVSDHAIPRELVLNFDQTGVNIVPVSNWTMETQGAKQVPIFGKDDKRQITVLLGTSLTGDLLPPQVIYQGKTDACHPRFSFPEDWNVTHSDNHWSTTATMEEYLDKVVIPYVDDQREALDLPLRQRALVIMDVFRAHRVDSIISKLKAHDIEVVYVPGGCTGELQPLDVAGNGLFKSLLYGQFESWYADQVANALAEDEEPDVDIRLTTLKPIHARWLLASIDELKTRKDELLRGWRVTGIKDAFDSASVESEVEVTHL